MCQTGHMNAIPLPGYDHGRYRLVRAHIAVDTKMIRTDVSFSHLGAVDNFNFLRRRYNDFFRHVPHFGIGHNQNRRPIFFRQVKCANGQVE